MFVEEGVIKRGRETENALKLDDDVSHAQLVFVFRTNVAIWIWNKKLKCMEHLDEKSSLTSNHPCHPISIL
jgi:hypothetical protein